MNDELPPIVDTAGDPVEHWLAEPEHPALAAPVADRINDPLLPDRLTWNAFRTLATWNTDAWMERFLDVALGEGNPLSQLEWGESSVELWTSGLHLTDATDVVISGPEAVVLVQATFRADLSIDALGEGVEHALALPDRGSRQAAFVLLTPGIDEAEADRVGDALAADLLDLPDGEGHGLRPEALEHLTGWLTWADLGALALDLAEEADVLRKEMVHLLISELQRQFPDLNA